MAIEKPIQIITQKLFQGIGMIIEKFFEELN
jgi:hypothetical protein